MPEWVISLAGYIIGGLGLGSLIIFFVQRHDTKKGLDRQLKKLEKDNVRTQLLLLMYTYDPKDEAELMSCAEHYFKDLDGNWFMTPKFNRFIQKNKIAKPEWLD